MKPIENAGQLEAYFVGLLRMSESGAKFPVDLDDVWPLVYTRKDHAVRDLTDQEMFVEGFDYQVFLKNGENPAGGRPEQKYKLTIACLEFFIAKRVRPVFEVYRRVFHEAVELSRQLRWEGLPTVSDSGRVWVNYMQALRLLGFSTRSGAVAVRKLKRPGEFTKFFGRNFISVDYADELHKQRRLAAKQRELWTAAQ